MSNLRLSPEELSHTLRRAEEIAERSREPAAPDSEMDAYLQAAEEMGIPREATLQALRERLLIPGEDFAVGQTVFARSVDGSWYPAEVTGLERHTAALRFLNGGEHTCALADLRPLALVPGRKITADIKHWGWYGVIVDRYDPEKARVHIIHDDWSGEREAVALRKIRLSEEQATPAAVRPARAGGSRLPGLLAAGGTGLLAGILADRLLPWLLGFFFR